MTRGRDAGVTLVEMLVALALFALVGLASFTTLDAIVKARTRTEGRLAQVTAIDRAFGLFGRDLAQADPRTVSGTVETVGIGPPGARLIWADAGNALIRHRDDTLRGETGPEQTLLQDLSSIRLRYLDADRIWHDVWPIDTEVGLIAVELTLGRRNSPGTLRKIVALAEDGM